MKHPRHGGRVLLERRETTDEAARYRVTLYASDGSWISEAAARGEGGFELGPWEGEGEPPEWLVEGARAHLRTLRSRAARDGWPRRVLRWREPR